MASSYDMLDERDSRGIGSNVEVRVLRAWRKMEFNNPSEPYMVECILLDEKGNRAVAQIKKELIYKFKRGLKEVFDVEEFMTDPVGGKYGFLFAKFSDIIEAKLDEGSLIDVIVEICNVSKKQTVNIKGVDKDFVDPVCDLVCKAKIVEIDGTIGWNYLGCPRCHKKVQEFPLSKIKVEDETNDFKKDENNARSVYYRCVDVCGKIVPNVTPRYKVFVTLKDQTNKHPFVFFDRDVENIVKISCRDLMETMFEDDDYEIGSNDEGFLGSQSIESNMLKNCHSSTSSGEVYLEDMEKSVDNTKKKRKLDSSPLVMSSPNFTIVSPSEEDSNDME
ncbi:OLC1v1030061C1 [Oldenlandia corymbosa var. corymbosa]|uniref:OLC1v1030061C1 n=1 Tax=Oldenlandia corymbosa var. corymbosa TaxID=529605 RepID=A0AAV1CIL3_OLDCO|nr:OLC1v1030061C1 [Oldenlandia corymbosa var. corymbosa]